MTTWTVQRQYNENIEETRDGATSEITYKVFCTQAGERGTKEEARAAFLDNIDSAHMRDIFGNRTARCRIEHDDGSAGRVYTVTLSFEGDTVEEEALKGENEYWCDSFNTMGGTSHVTQGYAEKRYSYNDEKWIPNFEGRIGWNGESFEGVDIVTPTLELSYKQRYEYKPFLNGSITVLADYTGSVNFGWFAGFAPGNVLFCGASGVTAFEQEGRMKVNKFGELVAIPTPYWDVTFSFKVQPTRTIVIGGQPLRNGITIGGEVVTKRGWDYVWQLYDTIEDSDTGTKLQIPRAIYVTQVYPEKDFGIFGF